MERSAELTWSFACPDWVERLKSGRSLVPDLPIDKAEGPKAPVASASLLNSRGIDMGEAHLDFQAVIGQPDIRCRPWVVYDRETVQVIIGVAGCVGSSPIRCGASSAMPARAPAAYAGR